AFARTRRHATRAIDALRAADMSDEIAELARFAERVAVAALVRNALVCLAIADLCGGTLAPPCTVACAARIEATTEQRRAELAEGARPRDIAFVRESIAEHAGERLAFDVAALSRIGRDAFGICRALGVCDADARAASLSGRAIRIVLAGLVFVTARAG